MIKQCCHGNICCNYIVVVHCIYVHVTCMIIFFIHVHVHVHMYFTFIVTHNTHSNTHTHTHIHAYIVCIIYTHQHTHKYIHIVAHTYTHTYTPAHALYFQYMLQLHVFQAFVKYINLWTLLNTCVYSNSIHRIEEREKLTVIKPCVTSHHPTCICLFN